jgi:hypothetical protein
VKIGAMIRLAWVLRTERRARLRAENERAVLLYRLQETSSRYMALLAQASALVRMTEVQRGMIAERELELEKHRIPNGI